MCYLSMFGRRATYTITYADTWWYNHCIHYVCVCTVLNNNFIWTSDGKLLKQQPAYELCVHCVLYDIYMFFVLYRVLLCTVLCSDVRVTGCSSSCPSSSPFPCCCFLCPPLFILIILLLKWLPFIHILNALEYYVDWVFTGCGHGRSRYSAWMFLFFFHQFSFFQIFHSCRMRGEWRNRNCSFPRRLKCANYLNFAIYIFNDLIYRRVLSSEALLVCTQTRDLSACRSVYISCGVVVPKKKPCVWSSCFRLCGDCFEKNQQRKFL